MYALDTNTVIYFFKGIGRVGERLFATAPFEIAIPAVVLFELEVGILNSSQPSKRRKQLRELLDVTSVISFDADAASRAAEISSALRKSGSAIGPLDTLIAGTALARGATLVTHNVAEFRRVRALRVEDWL